MEKKYYVFMGDVIASSRQQGVQKKLHEAVKKINGGADGQWIAPFEITRGDEVVLIADVRLAWCAVIRRFMHLMHPIKMRWVAVYGEISEGLSYGSSAEAVGPAFIEADHRMQQLKRTGRFFDMETGVKQINDCLIGTINLLIWRIYSLTPLQYEIFRYYQSMQNQTQVGITVKRTQQQVQKTLHDIGWEIVNEAEKAIDLLVSQKNEELADKKRGKR